MASKRSLLCRLGIHSAHDDECFIRYAIRHGKESRIPIAYYAICKRCWKKLYRTDKYGNRRY